MAVPTNITTGEQSVTTTGAITGTLSTVSLVRAGAIKLRVRNFTSGDTMRIVLEDTANASAFSDALQVWSADVIGAQNPDGNTFSVQVIDLPDMRFGAANTALRFNVQAISGGSANVIGWLEQ